MTNLEQFLNQKIDTPSEQVEPASGSFRCQHEDCEEIVSDGYITRSNHRLHWTCLNGHESSVVI
jgi:hypothetical protein